MTFKWLRYDLECEKIVMWTVADAEGEHVNAQAAIDREAVNAANIATLRAQLAARDAALDAVLSVINRRSVPPFVHAETRAFAEAIESLLLKHGVHPK